MPRRRKQTPTDLPEEVLDHVAGPARPMSAGAVDAITRRFTKAMGERTLGGERTHPLGDPPGGTKPETPSTHRNGTTGKTGRTDDGALDRAIPRDRHGSFEPHRIPQHARRFAGLDDTIRALDARGLTVREIQACLAERDAVEVSPDRIRTVTDAVHAEVSVWQPRGLAPMDPVVFVDALRVTMRDEGTVRRHAVHLALAVWPDGSRDILGLWIGPTVGAKFWLKVFTDLKTRGGHDIRIAVTDGLKGMREALAAVYIPPSSRAGGAPGRT